MSKVGDKRADLGSYAINSEAGCPWISAAESFPNAQRLRASKPSIKVTHILFDKMTEYTDDNYWIGTLKRMSTGRMPKYFKIVGPELVFRKRGGGTLSMIIPKQPEKVGEIINFFHSCGVYSHIDEKRNCLKHRNKIANFKPKVLKWSSISRNRLLLDQALTAFAAKKVDETGGGTEDFLELFKLLKLAAILQILNANNVEVKSNTIENVSVLLYDKETGRWDIDFNVARKRKSKSKPKEKDSISSIWKSYFELVAGDPALIKAKKASVKSTETEDVTATHVEASQTVDASQAVDASQLTDPEDAGEVN